MGTLWIAFPAILAGVIFILYRIAIVPRVLLKTSISRATVLPLRSTDRKHEATKRPVQRSLGLDTLPFDIWAGVFAYLSVRDLCVIERTSRSLFRMIRQRHTWSRVVSDVHHVKPLAYNVDLSPMTADELRAMAIRSVKLHNAMSQTFRPERICRAPIPSSFGISQLHSYPRGRCIVAGVSGELYLFSIQDGSCLDSVPRPYSYTPEELERDHWTVPVVISASQAYLFLVVNSDEDIGMTYRFKEAVIQLFSIEDRSIRLLRELPSDREIISVSASSRQWAYVSWEEQARSFMFCIFPISDNSSPSFEGVTYRLQFLANSPRLNPVTMAFVSDHHIMLADYRRICIYVIPDSSTPPSILVPIWEHLDDPRSVLRIPPNPRVAVASPSVERPDVLRFSLYSDGYLRAVRVSLPDSGTVQAIDMFLPEYSIYSLGATSVIIPDYSGDKHYHSISFTYPSSSDQCANRFEPTENNLVHGDLRLFVPDECQRPRALCLDEEYGSLIAIDFKFIYTYALVG